MKQSVKITMAFLLGLHGLMAGQGFAATADFRVYATSDVAPQTPGVRVFDATGFPIDQFETDGNAGVLLQDGNSILISISRPGQTVVDRYDLEGNFVENVIAFAGTRLISEMEFDQAGNIWVGDLSDQFMQFGPDGTLLGQFTALDDSRGKFALTEHETMYISARNAIHHYDLGGNLLSTTPTDIHFPGDIVIHPDGDQLYLASEPGALVTFDRVGGGDLAFVSLTPFQGVVTSIAIDMNWNSATGNLLVSDIGSSYDLTTAGDFVRAYAPVQFGYSSIAVRVPEPRAAHGMGLLLLCCLRRRRWVGATHAERPTQVNPGWCQETGPSARRLACGTERGHLPPKGGTTNDFWSSVDFVSDGHRPRTNPHEVSARSNMSLVVPPSGGT